mmetsp:Transcript_19175/g.19433  ORF Transcript_19175/g.19433 Transcript_19175/m.19433 type:complete len:221 (-) Transcript_19175:436-1098(-)
MINRLAHPHQQIKDVRIVIKQRAIAYVIIELGTALRIERVVKIFFNGVQTHVSDGNDTRRQIHVFGTRCFSASEKSFVEYFVFQDEHGSSSVSTIAVCLNRIQHILVKMGIMLHVPMSTIQTHSINHPIMYAFAIAILGLTAIVSHWINPQESYQTVKLSNAILQRRATQTPTMNPGQRERGRTGLGTAGFDVMRFIQHNPPPEYGMQNGHLRSLRRLLQ